MKKVVVVGSINMDLVTRCKRAPKSVSPPFGALLHLVTKYGFSY